MSEIHSRPDWGDFGLGRDWVLHDWVVALEPSPPPELRDSNYG